MKATVVKTAVLFCAVLYFTAPPADNRRVYCFDRLGKNPENPRCSLLLSANGRGLLEEDSYGKVGGAGFSLIVVIESVITSKSHSEKCLKALV